jgi:uncharacterized protein
MGTSTVEDIVAYLRKNKGLFHDRFGVTRLGIFGSFVRNEQSPSSDIDVVIEMEKSKKNIHCFLQLKRALERDLGREIDLGFEHSLKPIVREKLKEQIIYV